MGAFQLSYASVYEIELAVTAFMPDAVNTFPATVAYSSIIPVVLILAKPTALVPLSVILRKISLSTAGRIAIGPPVSVKAVLFDVPEIDGISSVTVLPTTEYFTVPVGDVVMPVAVAV
jgi:hypothetical protein